MGRPRVGIQSGWGARLQPASWAQRHRALRGAPRPCGPITLPPEKRPQGHVGSLAWMFAEGQTNHFISIFSIVLAFRSFNSRVKNLQETYPNLLLRKLKPCSRSPPSGTAPFGVSLSTTPGKMLASIALAASDEIPALAASC